VKTPDRALWLCGALLLCSAAWGWQEPEKPALPAGELAKAPAAAQARPNPYEGQPEAIQAGKKLFKRHCAECHGEDGRGRGKAPDLHSSGVQSASPGTLLWFLRNGNLREGMPSWSRLPEQRLWQLVSYLQTLK
jgi:mono/diheme cytochrome c family protein